LSSRRHTRGDIDKWIGDHPATPPYVGGVGSAIWIGFLAWSYSLFKYSQGLFGRMAPFPDLVNMVLEFKALCVIPGKYQLTINLC